MRNVSGAEFRVHGGLAARRKTSADIWPRFQNQTNRLLLQRRMLEEDPNQTIEGVDLSRILLNSVGGTEV